MAELPEIVIAAARAGQRDEYKLAIYRAISANQPRGLAGQAGIVKVEFRVMPDGSVTDVRIAASSRSRQLDENVMATMRGLRLPPPPRTLTADRLIYDLEFTFQ
jgi:TonB family protein